MAEATTRQAAVRDAAMRFAAAGIDQPLTDARALVAHALGIDRVALVTGRDEPLAPVEQVAVAAHVARRLTREPVSRIIGERWFRGRPFKLSAATLDPRPDSETLIDVVLAFVRERGLERAPLRLLDIGTGSGCLLLTLLAELPNASGVGTDLVPEALATAATNATNLGISPPRVTWSAGPGLDPVRDTFNVIVSNPPYIPSKIIDDLSPEVRTHDPRLALDGGPDGLRYYTKWSKLIWQVVDKKSGIVVYEVGEGQAASVARLLASAAQADAPHIATHRDLGGIARCVSAVTRSATPSSA